MKKLLMLLLLLGGVEISAQTIVQQEFAVSSQPRLTSDMDLHQPTGKGNVLIAMPGPMSPGVKVASVTDNAPGGSNIYKQVPGAAAACGNKVLLDIWYCENCRPGANELKFHFSTPTRTSVNVFMELSGMPSSSVLDGSGVNVSDGTRTSAGEVGPSITTTATDFVVGRYHSANPIPTGVTPEAFTYKTTYTYAQDRPAGTYQPTLTGGGTTGEFCMSMAAFKTAPRAAKSPRRVK